MAIDYLKSCKLEDPAYFPSFAGCEIIGVANLPVHFYGELTETDFGTSLYCDGDGYLHRDSVDGEMIMEPVRVYTDSTTGEIAIRLLYNDSVVRQFALKTE